MLPVYECTIDFNELELILLPQEYEYRVIESVKKRPIYLTNSKDSGKDFNAADRMEREILKYRKRQKVMRAIPRFEYRVAAFTFKK